MKIPTVLVLILAILFLVYCQRDFKELPLVQTTTIDSLSAKTAIVKARILDLGEGVSDHGHCYGKAPSPNLENQKTSFGIAKELKEFASELSDLEPGVAYYVRAYLRSGDQTYFGEDVKLITTDGKARVSTHEITQIGMKEAISGGRVASDGGDVLMGRGVCWDMEGPLSLDKYIGLTKDSSGLGDYESLIVDLDPGTSYLVRAYAFTSVDTSYGEVMLFTTKSVKVIFASSSISELTNATVITNNNILSDGGDSIMARGSCWDFSQSPTIEDNHTIDGKGTGIYESTLSGLSSGTGYYVRPYATNSTGTIYGNELHFTTLSNACEIPSGLSAKNPENDQEITLEWNAVPGAIFYELVPRQASASPMDTLTAQDNFMDYFIQDCGKDFEYQVRAYCIEEKISDWSPVFKFISMSCHVPILTTSVVTNITASSAQSGGSITDDGGSAVSAKGVCWSKNPNPTILDETTVNGNGSGDYISIMTELSGGESYNVRAFAINEEGVGYGDVLQFETKKDSILPSVSLPDTSNSTQTSINAWSVITEDGGSEVVARGFCWSTSPDPDLDDYYSNDGTGTGEFSRVIEGLNCGTIYYLKAYATNSVGITYSEEISFRTKKCYDLPIVSTLAISQLTGSSAQSGGSIIDDGGSLVTARGVCWSTNPNPTIMDYTTVDGIGSGTYISSISGLTVETTYYLRAYATNSIGTAYGDQQTFTTALLCPSGILAYWPLNDSTGTSYADITGVHTGFADTSAPKHVQGIIGGAQEFDGSKETYISIPAHSDFNWSANQSFTIELWVKYTSSTDYQVFIAADYYSGRMPWYIVAEGNTGRITGGLTDSEGVVGEVRSSISYGDNIWHHVALVRNAAMATSYLYIDGVIADSHIHSITGDLSPDRIISVGALIVTSPWNFLTGTVDEIAIYNRNLSSTEIMVHYTEGVLGNGYCK